MSANNQPSGSQCAKLEVEEENNENKTHRSRKIEQQNKNTITFNGNER